MNRIKIFLGGACMLFAIGAIAATKLTTVTLPEYYLSTADECIQITTASGCGAGTPNCVKTFSATEVNRPVYDVRSAEGECQNQLHQ